MFLVSYRIIALELSTSKLRHMLCDRTDVVSATGTHDVRIAVAIR